MLWMLREHCKWGSGHYTCGGEDRRSPRIATDVSIKCPPPYCELLADVVMKASQKCFPAYSSQTSCIGVSIEQEKKKGIYCNGLYGQFSQRGTILMSLRKEEKEVDFWNGSFSFSCADAYCHGASSAMYHLVMEVL